MYSKIIAIFAFAAVAAAVPTPGLAGLPSLPSTNSNNNNGNAFHDTDNTIDVVKKCSPNQALSCCDESTQSCSPLALVQVLPIGQACGNGNNVQCCDIDNFGLINLNILNCNRILS
ncbi:unnamed protein product [Periconia digitata]|uniref:Hydrophobin n=1 Tax=Periconia digitata TaxID=1303443 RepID=A0A9W4UM25_9PLEO|nr:unnamed protein product [Periconia digitata]